MEYSVCVSAVYSGVPIPEAIPRVKKAGYGAFEFWSWWDRDIDAINEARQREGLKVAAFCTRFSPLNDPSQRKDYIEGLRASVSVAKKLECPVLISQVGRELKDVPRSEQHRCIVEGLKQCAPIAEDAGIVLAIEPLNTLVDHKGYYLSSSSEGFEIVREVGSPNVKLLFDVYHQQITEGNIISSLTGNISDVAHVHIAGNPGRHEPYEHSELDYAVVLRALKKAGYAGYVGLEYLPLKDPDESIAALLQKLPTGS